MVLEVLDISVEVKRGLLLLRDIHLSIAKGENPRVIEQKLNAYIPHQLRETSFEKK